MDALFAPQERGSRACEGKGPACHAAVDIAMMLLRGRGMVDERWWFEFHLMARREYEDLAKDLQARLAKLGGTIETGGLSRLPPKATRHLEGELWELRLDGKSGIARAIYAARGRRVVVLRIFVKKTQKTPRREIALAEERLRSLPL